MSDPQYLDGFFHEKCHRQKWMICTGTPTSLETSMWKHGGNETEEARNDSSKNERHMKNDWWYKKKHGKQYLYHLPNMRVNMSKKHPTSYFRMGDKCVNFGDIWSAQLTHFTHISQKTCTCSCWRFKLNLQGGTNQLTFIKKGTQNRFPSPSLWDITTT